MMRKVMLRTLTLASLTLFLTGCREETNTPSKPSDGSGLSEARGGAGSERSGGTPIVPIMEEIDGIPIPRVETDTVSLDMNSEIATDVGNDAANGDSGKKVTGGRIIVRMRSEPKSMNPITESSAVRTYMSDPYLIQGLASQNPETFVFEPMLATSWVAEDSIKLAPGYEGFERFVSLEGKEPQQTLSVKFPKDKDEKTPGELSFTTYGPDKKPLGNVWVGLFPEGDIPGAPKNGAHNWSDENGTLVVSGLPAGPYTIKVGHEIYGVTELVDEKLQVRSDTAKNPLSDLLKKQKSEYLTLTPDEDFIDIQRSTIFTFRINPKAKWSDGTPYTSRDLEFAYAVIRNPIVDGDSIRTYYQNVIRCDPLDKHTVQMQYREQYFQAFEFTAGLASYGPPMHLFEKFFKEDGKTLTLEHLTEAEEKSQQKISVHGAAFGKFFNTDSRYNAKPMGTGPYVIDSWVKGDRITMKRNPNYWTENHKGYLDEIAFKFIVDDVTALQAIEGGEIDFLYRMTAEKYHEALKGPPDWFKGKYVKASWYIPAYSYIGWNLNRDLFKDRKVRLALALLMDLETFREQKIYGEAVLVSGSSYYFAPAYDQDVKPIGYDEETAKDLLSEAGWADTDGDGILDRNGVPFKFSFELPTGSETGESLAAIFQENAKKAGIQIEVKRLEWASFLENVMNKDFDAVTLAWASAPESDPFQLWHGSEAGDEKRSSNHVSFKNEKADELIEAIRVTLNKEERTKLFHQFHHILDQEQPYMFLYTPKEFGVYNNRYRGVKWYRLRPGFDLTEWYVPKNLQRK